MANYKEIRLKIFGTEPNRRPRRSTMRMRDFWSRIKETQKDIVNSIFEEENDLRPYAEITLFCQRISGLLDTEGRYILHWR